MHAYVHVGMHRSGTSGLSTCASVYLLRICAYIPRVNSEVCVSTGHMLYA